MPCVGVEGALVPDGMRALFSVSMRLLGVWPCALIVPQTRLCCIVRIRAACQ
jgi:hypothetical protein